jgi:hypothetical protein
MMKVKKLGFGYMRLIPLVLASLTLAHMTLAAEFEMVIKPRQQYDRQALPPVPPDYTLQLMIDDDSSESDLGVVTSNGAGKQFLWFNQFATTGFPIQIEEIWVLFPPGDNISVGNQVQLVVFSDPDLDPSNGATFIAGYDVTIQVVDGVTFSVYEIDPPLQIDTEGDVLVGVVNRFVTSGVTSTTQPAAIDTTASQGRSWLAIWNSDPPDPPTLPADGLNDLVDRFEPGNWMIRAFGEATQPQPLPAIPTMGRAGLVVLVVLLAVAGAIFIRRI